MVCIIVHDAQKESHMTFIQDHHFYELTDGEEAELSSPTHPTIHCRKCNGYWTAGLSKDSQVTSGSHYLDAARRLIKELAHD